MLYENRLSASMFAHARVRMSHVRLVYKAFSSAVLNHGWRRIYVGGHGAWIPCIKPYGIQVVYKQELSGQERMNQCSCSQAFRILRGKMDWVQSVKTLPLLVGSIRFNSLGPIKNS